MKVNYDEEMMNEIGKLDSRKSLLLHSCCGPCSSACIERLKDYFDITVIYYNPNIEPHEEYLKRKNEQKRLLDILNIKFLDCDYDNEVFRRKTESLKDEPEGGKRCSVCFGIRLEYTAGKALELGFDYFTTTLTVSPHKNSQLINEIGSKIGEKYNIKYLYSDFKKRDGYKRSIELSKKYDLYRQNYCGCLYSKGEFEMKENKGFTLVELLAVISIIGVVCILVMPTLMQTFYNSKEVLDGYSLEGVEDAGKMYITDLDEGVTSYTYTGNTSVEVNGNTYNKGDVMSSYDFKVYVINNGGLLVTMETLVAGGYYDKNCKYAGTSITYTDSNGVEQTKVITEDTNCSMPKECTLRVGINGKLVEDGAYYVSNGYTAEIISGCE